MAREWHATDMAPDTTKAQLRRMDASELGLLLWSG